MKKITILWLMLLIAIAAFGDGPVVIDTFEAFIFYLEMGNEPQMHLNFDELGLFESFNDGKTDIPFQAGFPITAYIMCRTADSVEARNYVVINSPPRYVESNVGTVEEFFQVSVYDSGTVYVSVIRRSPISGDIVFLDTVSSHLAKTRDDKSGVYVYR
jgi:hypothetical protein